MNERDRVLQVMQSEGMNAKQFCQEVGISQGTLSNIMGGRNKPSLDVMQSILRRFRAVNCDWLIMGVGTMYANGTREDGVLPLFTEEQVAGNSSNEQKLNTSKEQMVAASNLHAAKTSSNISHIEHSASVMLAPAARTVSKILVFYSDGTFEEG